MARQQPWRDFEVLLATIHKKLAPGADVAHNSYITGRSGRRRQIDILISQTVGLYKARIVIECRRYRRPVTIDKVEAFVAKLTDLGASQGVMVSRTGFDGGARAIAKDNRITLLTYREATELDWLKATGASAWVRFIATRSEPLSVSTNLPGQPDHTLGPDSTVSNISAGSCVSISEFAQSIARESPLGQRPGTYSVDFEADDRFGWSRMERPMTSRSFGSHVVFARLSTS